MQKILVENALCCRIQSNLVPISRAAKKLQQNADQASLLWILWTQSIQIGRRENLQRHAGYKIRFTIPWSRVNTV